MVVDDHPMWRDAVERDLQAAGFDVVGVAADGTQAIARFPAARPQVVVLDLQIPGPNGVEVTAQVLQHDPSARVLILSASGEQADVLAAVKAGATGYLVKSASRTELIDAVRRVAAGDTVFTPGLAGLVLGEFRRMADARPTGRPGRAAHRARDRGAQDGGEGDVLQADRRAAGDLPPDRPEPRPEHAAQAADAQPRGADPLRHRAGARRRLELRWARAGGPRRRRRAADLERDANLVALAHVFPATGSRSPDGGARALAATLAEPGVVVEVVDGRADWWCSWPTTA